MMRLISFIFLLISVVAAQNDTGAQEIVEPEIKIVGGTTAIPNEFPWAVRIQFKSNKGLLCGGTLIQEDLILTAAHCLIELSLSSVEVVAGEHDTNKNDGTEQTRNVNNERTFDNDIGLIAVTSKFNIGRGVAIAKLPASNQIPTAIAKAVGWGALSEGSRASNVLMKVDLDFVSNTICNRAYQFVTNNMICYERKGKDSCQGDSGGGLICGSGTSSNICGIVSFGNGCAREGYPGVYTKVTSYLSWISSNLKENTSSCNCKYVTGHASLQRATSIVWIIIGFITIANL